MPGAELYREYTRQEAVALSGPEAEGRVLCDGQWAIFPHAILCLTTVAAGRPGVSRFRTPTRFHWVADKPYRIREGDRTPFAPEDLDPNRLAERPIRLFARGEAAARYTYLGELRPHLVIAPHEDYAYGQIAFDLAPALSSAVRDRLIGPPVQVVSDAEMDAAFASLRGPTTVEQRLKVLRTLVEYWHAPLDPEDGFREQELGHPWIPSVLYWWYRWAGRRKDITGSRTEFLDPRSDDPWKLQDGLLEFYCEESGFFLATAPDGEDPLVVSTDRTLSENLMAICLYHALEEHAQHGVFFPRLAVSRAAELFIDLPELPIVPLFRDHAPAAHFRGHHGAFLYARKYEDWDDGRPAYYARFGAREQASLEFLKPWIATEPGAHWTW